MPRSEKKYYGVARVLSKRGVCSRKEAEEACRTGKVSLNGKVVFDPETKATLNSEICLKGQKTFATEKLYFAFHKPRGIICSAKDEKGRISILDFFKNLNTHLFSVGRLDKASEGLIFVTNDTDFSNRISTSYFPKIYHVKISRERNFCPTAEELKMMETGMLVPPRVFTEKEVFLKMQKVRVLRIGEKSCWLEVTLTEGKNREIRRICKHFQFEVLRLVRVQIGNFKLNALKPGTYIPINPKEIFP